MDEFKLIMDKLLGPAMGFAFGVTATIIGIIVTDKMTTKREQISFYGWIESLLYRLIEKKEFKKVEEDLCATELHYTFNKLWTRIPEKVRIKKGVKKLPIRNLIFKLIKGGGNLKEVVDDKDIHKLNEWLKKK